VPSRPTLAVLALSFALAAGTPPLPAQAFPAPRPEDAAAIRAMLQASADGWNEASLAKHVSIYVDSVTFMTRQGPRPGKDQIVSSFTDTYFRDGKPIQSLSFSEVVQRGLGPDHVLMTGRFRLSGGDRPDQTGWFTLIWARTSDGWRVLHDHSS
jgi:ketosteroid isomerase-like protein